MARLHVSGRYPHYGQVRWYGISGTYLAAACAAHAGLGPASLVLYDVLLKYKSPAKAVAGVRTSILWWS